MNNLLIKVAKHKNIVKDPRDSSSKNHQELFKTEFAW